MEDNDTFVIADSGNKGRFASPADMAELMRRYRAHDALVAALEYTKEFMHPYTPAEVRTTIDAALALARKD